MNPAETISPPSAPAVPAGEPEAVNPRYLPAAGNKPWFIRCGVPTAEEDRKLYEIRYNRDVEIRIERKRLLDIIEINEWFFAMQRKFHLNKVVNS